MATRAEQPENVDTPQGLAYAMTAYLLWGFLPLYMKLVAHMPALEVVAHRVIWSVPIAGLVLIVMRRTSDLVAALSTTRTRDTGCLAAAMLPENTGDYVWSIARMRG